MSNPDNTDQICTFGNRSSIVKIDPSNISFGPSFEVFYPVLALTKVGSATPLSIDFVE
jgi:hypothetical protein